MKINFLFFLLLLFLVGCKKEEKQPEDSFYFKGLVNGNAINWVAPYVQFGMEEAEFSVAFPSSVSLEGIDCTPVDLPYQDHEGTCIYETESTPLDYHNSIEVSFVSSSNHDMSWNPLYMRPLFTNGTKNFGLLRENCSDPILNGIIISYYDANGKLWQSSWGDQSMNKFEQVSLEDETRTNMWSKKWKVRFNGRLYDQSGNHIVIQNCEVYGPVFSY